MDKKYCLRPLALFSGIVMLMGSCQRDGISAGPVEGEEHVVTVTAVFPSARLDVKSQTVPGDGTLANRCLMQVYVADDPESLVPYDEPQETGVDALSASFELRLISGHDYRLVFWADCAEKGQDGGYSDIYYNTEAFPEKVSIIPETFAGNDDARDAFFGSASVTAEALAAGTAGVSAELRRPFGQLNIITNDWGAIPEEAAYQLRPAKVKLTFNGVPNTIDLLTGEVSGAAYFSGEAVEVSEIAQDGDAKHLSFDYILAKEGEQTILPDFTMDFLADDGNTKVTDTYTFTNIPVQRNYQTNVRGNLLTDRTEIEVNIVPGFDGKYPKKVSDAQTLLTVLDEGGYARLTGDVAMTGASAVADGKEVVLDLDGHSLTLHGTMSTSGTSSLTLMNGTVKSSESYENVRFLVSASAGGSVALENVTMTSAGAGIGVEPSGDPGKVTVRNSSITAYSYAVGTNASTPIHNAEIELYNSKLVGMSAVLMNLPSVITVSGCTLQGSMHAMILRAGTAEITDSHLKLKYDSSNGEGDTAEDAKDNYIDKWGTGNAVPLAAITVGNDNSDGYLYPTVLKIDNSVITADESGALPAMYVRANTDAANGVTITYGEDCKVEGNIVYYDDGNNITVNGTPVTE